MSITRRNCHKPSSALLSDFKKTFPNLAQTKASALPATPPTETSDKQSLAELMSFDPRQYHDSEEHGNQDTSFQDPSFDLSHSRSGSGSLNYAAALLDFPTPTGWYQNQNQNTAGYYPSPGQFQWPNSLHQGMPTPYSRSMSLSSPGQNQQPGFLSLQDVQLRPSYQGGTMDYPTLQSFSTQQASSNFRSAYDTSVNPTGLLPSQNTQNPAMYHGQGSDSQFRFQTTLLNSTAMVKDNEVPVSYLNKRQLYKVAIVDTRPQTHGHLPTTYRTYLRISFHEERQRAHPDQHWQLWKEGRGMNEAQQHGGALRAIEHVPLPSGPGHHPNVHVEKDSFDGFCVTWNAAPGLRPSCELQFRCNFLSTDFSRSKGVKGIPVRLCAKSEEVGFSSDRNPSSNTPEICYCKIKLFRDHGAERKLSNDEAAVRRAIKKIEDQLKESGAEENVEEPISFGSSNKRRAGDISPENKRPNKLARKARAASTSSEGSSQGHVVGEGDASQKLASLNRFLRSRLEITSFSLQGLAADDPDLHPVTLKDSELKATRDSSPELQRVSRTETGMTEQSAASSALTSTFSVSSPQLRKPTYLQVPTPMISQNNSEEWQSACKEEQNADRSTPNIQANNASPQDERKHSTRISFGDGKSFQVLDVDPTYRPPPLPVSRPVACFYVKPSFPGVSSPHSLYRACYVYERTASELISVIAKKVNLNPLDIINSSLIRQPGNHEFRVNLDDDVIQHMTEGQDLRADFTDVSDAQSAAPPRYDLTLH